MSANPAKQTILAVDDAPENLDVVKGTLVPEYSVKAAINGKMGLKIAQSQAPDLILLDIMMPEMDGYEVCRQLKSNPMTSEIPIIFLTAKDQVGDEAKGFELGAADYILKPVSPAILKARVKTHLTLRRHMKDLQEAYRIIRGHKERMEEELNVGWEIQSSMLPVTFPPFPDRKEFDIYASLHPAREVGGDFYDFFFIDESRLCFSVGDVSGKGVPAALFMAMTKTLLKSRARTDLSPASILTHANEELSEDNDSAMFVTIFLAILNVKTGDLIYTNAGHNPVCLKRAAGGVNLLKKLHGPVIGALEGMTYEEDRIQLVTDDVMLMYTDGVTEAMDVNQNLFSEQRLVNWFGSCEDTTVEGIVHRLAEQVKRFEDGVEQTDDITVMSIKFND